jgi:3-methyladenine DNA glycosylase AlkD
MTQVELLRRLREQLREAADPVYRDGAGRFFKGQLDLYGVRTPEVRRIAAVAYRDWKTWPDAARNRFCDALWKSGRFEEGGVAIALYQRVARTCARCEFKLFERWLDRYVNNWAHCDGIASWLLAGAIANEPRLMLELPSWTTSPNRWKRRAAAVSFLQEAKKGRHTPEILHIADRLLDDHDDMVQKGVGWLLKEAYPRHPTPDLTFLEARKHRPTRTLLRYAAEKMSVSDRRRVLA